ncbi:MAG: hypothetical protein IKX71_08410 [Bacteroidales bacterium]|nr:hypothetical protein [Bacteroidales bacterium]
MTLNQLTSRNNAAALILFLLFTVLTTACNKTLSKVAPIERSFLPGECLCSSFLEFNRFNITANTSFELSFILDLDYVPVSLGSPYSSQDYRLIPTESTFSVFKENAGIVKNLYEEAWRTITDSCKGDLCFASSIFYNGGARLVANKEFAGISAGGNIPIMMVGMTPSDAISIPTDNTITYNYCIYRALTITIPINNYEIIDDTVTFSLEIPVKVGLFLTWLNDRISNPNAPFPYRDETLTCSFTLQKGLH